MNGTLSGKKSAVNAYITETSKIFGDVDWKCSKVAPESYRINVNLKSIKSDDDQAFDNLIVKQFPSIVGNNPELKYSVSETGIHLSPDEFHDKIKQSRVEGRDDFILVDVRNSYEYAVGHFKDAINPNTRNFNSFEGWIDKAKDNNVFDGKKNILMYCTGGIRCEKASIQLKKKLYNGGEQAPKVFQLEGGIHRYLERFGDNPTESFFQGKNFVFDKRIVQSLESDNVSEISGDQAVVGSCSVCLKSFDKIRDDRRCRKCRLLILVCDDCDLKLAKDYFCSEHRYLDPKVYKSDPSRLQDLRNRLEQIDNHLSSEELRGRRLQSKRTALKRRKQELEKLLNLVMNT